MEKLREHDKKFAEHDLEFKSIQKQFGSLEKYVDRLTLELVTHTTRLDRIEENMATKEDLRDLTEKMDTLIGFYQHDNQEVTLLAYALSKHDDRIQMLEGENIKIKFKINLD